MADTEDKEKAEKVAAARKRYEQLKKQKAKESKKGTTSKKSKDDKDDKSSEKTDAADVKEDIAKGQEADDGEDEGKPEVAGDGVEDKSDELTEVSKSTPPPLSTTSRVHSSSLRSPPLPLAGEEGDAVKDIYRRQTARIEELEKENKRLQDEAGKRRELEEEVEGFRERAGTGTASGDSKEVLALKEELAVTQRQLQNLQSQVSKRRTSSSQQSSTEELQTQLSARQSTIETLELDISNLRHTLFQSESTTSELKSQISTLQAENSTLREDNTTMSVELTTLRKTQEDSKSSVDPSTDDAPDAKTLQTDLTTAQVRISTLTKKIETLQTLHRDSESRAQAQTASRLKEIDRLRNESNEMRRKLTARSNENARLRSASQSQRPGSSESADSDDALRRRVRELETEVFNLRSGRYQEAKRRLSTNADGAGVFDDVDLSPPAVDRMRKAGPYGAFSFDNIINTFTGRPSGSSNRKDNGAGFFDLPTRDSQDLDREEEDEEDDEEEEGLRTKVENGAAHQGDGDAVDVMDDEDDFEFNEEAYAAAAAEEAQKRLERAREIQRKLKDWKGYRVDMVDVRGGAMAGVFDI